MKSINLMKPFNVKKISLKKSHKTIAIAGNPNVGKSTVFNALTGLHQHTGNWPGKTVERATGKYTYNETEFNLVDIPGTYSLLANSPEEEIARDFICFQKPDAIIVVMDSTCIERNLNLTLQILEITSNVVVCLNLIDEAKRKNIFIDTDELSMQLGGIPVVCTNARRGVGVQLLMEEVDNIIQGNTKTFVVNTDYGEKVDSSIENLNKKISSLKNINLNTRWVSLKLLENDTDLCSSIKKHWNKEIFEKPDILNTILKERKKLLSDNISSQSFRDLIINAIIKRSEIIYKLCVKIKKTNYDKFDRRMDRFLTSPLTGFPTMILFLLGIFWITISGANYPSELIATVLFGLQDTLMKTFLSIGFSPWICNLLVLGVYKTLAWVVSVMLPPMAIFFPLFTLLEDIGYLPRIAFNLDKVFKKCGSHGKQALTMCMGFGCNACGVIGCRIIDSPREQLIAILTNNFVPCNGRFPLLISIITMFFIGNSFSALNSLLSTILLTSIILLGILVTFIISKVLSKTLLKGVTSSFILELPPYRKPQVTKILIRSLLDRTIFVLGRAVIVAAPAGLLIWLMANVHINNISLLMYSSNFLDPFAKLIGLDGVILTAFILGFPANEIVFPIIIMSYMCTGTITELQTPAQLHYLLTSHGWTYITAICTMIFSLMHFPCGTTCWTIKKETKSFKWTLLSFVLPTIVGILVCFTVANVLRIFDKII